MSNGDYGYFGKGDTGYAQYMSGFSRNFGGSSGGGGGGGNHNNNGGGGGDGHGAYAQPGDARAAAQHGQAGRRLLKTVITDGRRPPGIDERRDCPWQTS